MARLTPKEPEFKLYKTGFDGDLLDRKASGAALSGLVERIEDPMVIALDGGWGTGKSWFLKRWVGQHRTDYPGKARTVYFDAFAHDYLDDPLVALTALLTKELAKETSPASDKISRLKRTAFKALPGLTKLSANVATAFAIKALDDTGDILADAIGGAVEGSSDAFWQSVADQQTAMEEFASALKALTLTDNEDTPRKLVIVVDELDRCRPDYALSLLEVIKHFFAVDHVHFVLGVNLRELENMVRVRYGTQEGAALYLQKFVTLTMELEKLRARVREANDGSSLYFEVPDYIQKRSRALGVNKKTTRVLNIGLGPLYQRENFSLRHCDQILRYVALLPSDTTKLCNEAYFSDPIPQNDPSKRRLLLVVLLICKAIFPDVFAKIKKGEATRGVSETLCMRLSPCEFVGSFVEPFWV